MPRSGPSPEVVTTPQDNQQAPRINGGGWRLVAQRRGPRKQKPRQSEGAGAKFAGQQNGACRLSGWEECGSKPTDSTRQTHHRLHARTGRLTLGCTARGRSQKKPRRSGAKFLAGVCPSRGKANPPIHYHSWLRSGDFVERAPPEAEKAPPEGAGPSWSRLSDEGCRRVAKSSAASPLPQRPAASSVARREGDACMKKPRRGAGLGGLRVGLSLATPANPQT